MQTTERWPYEEYSVMGTVTDEASIVQLRTPFGTFVGTSRCHPEDTPNHMVGEPLALARAFKKAYQFYMRQAYANMKVQNETQHVIDAARSGDTNVLLSNLEGPAEEFAGWFADQ